ncbi:hypothetical protein ES703_56745 [subsurface metagenome]
MRVCANNDHTGQNGADFRQQGMFHPNLSLLIKMDPRLFSGKVFKHFHLFCRENILVGGKMVRDQINPFRISDLFASSLVEFSDRQRRRDIIGQSQIRFYLNELSRLQAAGMSFSCQYDLSKCHAHYFTATL